MCQYCYDSHTWIGLAFYWRFPDPKTPPGNLGWPTNQRLGLSNLPKQMVFKLKWMFFENKFLVSWKLTSPFHLSHGSTGSGAERKTNITLENPRLKMYFALNMGIFQCHVSFQGGKWNLTSQGNNPVVGFGFTNNGTPRLFHWSCKISCYSW